MTALAGEKIGLFARTGQLSLKSGEGLVEMQAQNGRLEFFAQKKFPLTSTEDILFAGKKRITLMGGGSYLRIDGCRIEYGTTGVYQRRVKRTSKRPAQNMPLTMPLFPGQFPPLERKICIPCLLNAIKANDAIVQGAE